MLVAPVQVLCRQGLAQQLGGTAARRPQAAERRGQALDLGVAPVGERDAAAPFIKHVVTLPLQLR